VLGGFEDPTPAKDASIGCRGLENSGITLGVFREKRFMRLPYRRIAEGGLIAEYCVCFQAE
jgi:hypothetical protein